MRASRWAVFQPARLRRFLSEPVGLARRSRFAAVCRTTAMVSGPWPVRRRARSSLSARSKTQCRRFSMAQWPRRAGEGRGVEPGGARAVAPRPLDLAAALGGAPDHADHAEAAGGGLARVAA